MNEVHPTHATGVGDQVTAPLPTDQKLFYGFVVVVVLALLAVIVFLTQPPAARPALGAPEMPRLLGAFGLTDRSGRTVTHGNVAGKFLVVNFVHTGCSISCLKVNEQMAEIQRRLAGADDVRLLSLTVDPRTDTPEVLAEFGMRFNAETNRWFLLTGDRTLLYELIEDSFLKRDPLASDIDMPGGFIGVERIAVVDREGNVRRYFDGMKKQTAAEVTAFVEELRVERRKP